MRRKKKLKNKFEKRIESQLKRAKIDFKYEGLKIPYVLARHYIPDFILNTPSGKIYIECKGYFRPEHRAKMAAVKKQNPQYDIRFVFYSEKSRDIKWCEKLGFKYSIGKIPKDWFL